VRGLGREVHRGEVAAVELIGRGHKPAGGDLLLEQCVGGVEAAVGVHVAVGDGKAVHVVGQRGQGEGVGGHERHHEGQQRGAGEPGAQERDATAAELGELKGEEEAAGHERARAVFRGRRDAESARLGRRLSAPRGSCGS